MKYLLKRFAAVLSVTVSAVILAGNLSVCLEARLEFAAMEKLTEQEDIKAQFNLDGMYDLRNLKSDRVSSYNH